MKIQASKLDSFIRYCLHILLRINVSDLVVTIHMTKVTIFYLGITSPTFKSLLGALCYSSLVK